jgi:hypothetical protein
VTIGIIRGVGMGIHLGDFLTVNVVTYCFSRVYLMFVQPVEVCKRLFVRNSPEMRPYTENFLNWWGREREVG